MLDTVYWLLLLLCFLVIFYRHSCRPNRDWRGAFKKDPQVVTLVREESDMAALSTDNNGVGLWPNASLWMWAESRSRSRS